MIQSLAHRSGLAHLRQGFHLILQPGLRLFVLLPLLINLLLFSAAFYWLLHQLERLSAWIDGSLPDWLGWLTWLIWPLAILGILIGFGFVFGMLANWIAAPFNGLLAEKVEQHLTGERGPDTGVMGLLRDVPRVFGREWLKLKFYLPKAIGCLLLFLIPGLGQTLAPLIWFLFSAWMMSIQYVDYAFDNHKIPFPTMLAALRGQRGYHLGFGSAVTVCSSLPILNFIIMPVAVCGATAIWVDLYRTEALSTGNKKGA